MSFDVADILTKLATKHNKKFMYKNEALPVERVFALDGALYILVNRANMLADFLFGEKLKVSFLPDENALNGERIEISPDQQSFVLVMLLYDVLEEFVVNAGDGDIVLA